MEGGRDPRRGRCAYLDFVSGFRLRGTITNRCRCFGGASICLGLLTYGYHVMRNLGNRLTLMSPSRGFCMELGGAMTVLMATRLKIPVSTTQSIAGAAIGVGLANGDWRCINLRLVAWIYFGWFLTVPCTAFIAGSLMALIVNAPRWDRL